MWQRWQQFLIYVGYTILAFVVNAFMNSVLPVIYRGACKFPFSCCCISARWLIRPSYVVDWWVCAGLDHRVGLRVARL